MPYPLDKTNHYNGLWVVLAVLVQVLVTLHVFALEFLSQTHREITGHHQQQNIWYNVVGLERGRQK